MKCSLGIIRTGALLALAGASLTLAACSHQDLAADTKFTPSAGSEQYPIRTVRGPVTLNVSNRSGTLQAAQINAVASFAHDAAVSGASVVIARPSRSGSRLSSEIANLLAQEGVSSHSIRMTSYAGSSDSPVRITYSTTRATVRKCGDWSEDVSDTKMNEPMPNFGCAVQSNIALMVANPEDFNNPEPTDPAWASSRTAGVQKITSGKSSGASSGSSSSAGSGSSSGSGSGSSGGATN